jgi:hypothetical protein
MSKPSSRSKRKAKKAKHKSKMRKLAKRRERMAATSQRAPLGSHIMEPNEATSGSTTPEQQAADDMQEQLGSADPIDGEVIEEDALEAEETTTLNEGHAVAESSTETTTEVQAEPGTEGVPQQAEGAENNG